jgi:hypothetical protein
MARTKKKTLPQSVVDVATTGMPQPVKRFLGGRIVALLIVAGGAVLIATGTLQIRWENGRPSISINKQRAAELKQEAVTKLQQLEARRADSHTPTVKIPGLDGREAAKSIDQRVEKLKDKIDQNIEEGWQQFRSSGGN